ncbi:MAG TPA: phosphate ABC transporter ATP-binding protein [Acidimicrobiales bacterium]|nr:phosphate ABC transporter ATP-binding protein [Acidimicrobiales bacterium]
MPQGAVFAFRDVSVSFDGVTVLDRVSFEVQERTVTVLTGPSGAGKTTLLRLCNRLEVPTGGTVRYRETDVATMDPLLLRRRVGMVFQRPTLFPGTLRSNFQVARPAEDAVYRTALDQVGLPAGWLDRGGDELSGGEAQRACLARTLLTEPDVLLMDEPTSSLDFAATRVLEELSCDLTASGLTLIWVSHDLEQVGRIADASVVLMGGRLVQGSLADSYLAGSVPEKGDAQ